MFLRNKVINGNKNIIDHVDLSELPSDIWHLVPINFICPGPFSYKLYI